MTDYVEPEVNKDVYNCPHCGSYSDQFWNDLVHNHNIIKEFTVGRVLPRF